MAGLVLGEPKMISSDLSLFFYGLMNHPLRNLFSVPSTELSSPKVLAQCLDGTTATSCLIDYAFCDVYGGDQGLPGEKQRGELIQIPNSGMPMEVVNSLIEEL